MNRIERIAKMENALDASRTAISAMQTALEEYEAVQDDWKKLSDYYGSAQWMRDFEADEAGKLPKDLKRGVLSEDAVYDLLIENRELVGKMARLVAGAIEKNTI